jgi:hypothetical protein
MMDTIAPRCKWYETRLKALLAESGMRIEFAIDELPEMQEDEAKRAQAFKLYVDGGMPAQVAAAILGVDIPKGFEWFWEEKQPSPQTNVQPPPPTTPESGQAPPNPAVEEMKRWERKALRAVKSGRAAQVEFLSDMIPQEVKKLISEALVPVKTEDEVKGVFTAFGVKGNGHMSPLETMLMMKSAQQSTSINFNGEDIGLKIAEALSNLKVDMPAMQVNVPAPIVNVLVPKQDAPVINIPAPIVNVAAPEVTVNVPEQAAPVVNVALPQGKAPEVVVNVEQQPTTATVERDAQGRIKRITQG